MTTDDLWRCCISGIKKSGMFGIVLAVGISMFQLFKGLSTHHYLLSDNVHTVLEFPTQVRNQFTAANGHHGPVSIDLVSIGTKNRPAYQIAQQNATTFGSHRSVRHFIRVTEDDDSDQACYLNLTNDQAYEISRYCRSKQWGKQKFLLQYLRNFYAVESWLREKANAAGWVCAHRRPVHGFAKAIQLYRDHNETFPDYLVIMDDDTYYNMELVSQFLESSTNQSLPLSLAGCLVRHPIYMINFTFPFGGFGIIYNKRSLENMIRPIRCRNQEHSDDDDFLQGSCQAIKDNQIYEQEVFQEGMSVSDLMQAYASWQPYSDFRNWSTGYCLHADWMFGYFTNFYPVVTRDQSPFWNGVPQARLQGYNGSELYGRKNLGSRKQCNNQYEKCSRESHICHYQNPQMIERLSVDMNHGSRR